MIPDFPRFTALDLTHREEVNGFLSRHPLEASEYTFTNLFAFRDAYNFRLSILKDNLIIYAGAEPAAMFCPVGNNRIPEVMEEMFDHLEQAAGSPFLERVPESFVYTYVEGSGRFQADEEREHFDYLYDVRELTELKGRKFHDKRNRVNTFRNTYEYEYMPLTDDLIEECLEFKDYWCQDRECDKHPGLLNEERAVFEMLHHFASLDIKGGTIRIKGRIAALTIGEQISPDTLVIHIEKAHADISGLYQVINQEFLLREAGECRFVNREQDLGIRGLRNAKMSYNPLRFIKKYRVGKKITQRHRP